MCVGGLVQQVRVQPAGAGGAARPRGGRQLRHPPHARRNLLTDWDPAQAGDTTADKAVKIVFFLLVFVRKWHHFFPRVKFLYL